MIIESLEVLSKDINRRAKAVNFTLDDPEEIQYGFGWEPTITFWKENRRVHFYFDSVRHGGIYVEVAEIHPGLKLRRGSVETNSLVKKTILKTTDEAWLIIDSFLRQKCDFAMLPDFPWTEDTTDVDKFIPHPPNLNNSANIVSLVDELKQKGEVWDPKHSKRQSWWKQFFKSWFIK